MSDLPNDIDAATLARYLSGECGSAEAETIRRWIEADPERQRRVEALRAAWTEAEGKPVEWDVDGMWSRVAARMDRPAERPPLRIVPPADEAPRTRRQAWLARSWSAVAGLAAAIMLVVGGSLWLSREVARRPAAPVPMREVVTTRGQRAEVRLGDGSRVVLGVQSRIRFPEVAGAGAREVELEGEAFFEVEHDEKHPFLVRAGGTVTEDLGTEFVIRAYPGDSAVRVVVASGEVAVGRAGAPASDRVALAPGDLAMVDSVRGTLAVERGVDLGTYVGWTEGRLQFRRMPLAQVVRELERWYAVDIRLPGGTLGAVPFTASFKEQSVNDVLDAVARSLDLVYRRQGDTLWLLPRPARH